MDYKIPGYTLHPVNLDKEKGRGIAVYTIATLDKSVNQILEIPRDSITGRRCTTIWMYLSEPDWIRHIVRKQR